MTSQQRRQKDGQTDHKDQGWETNQQKVQKIRLQGKNSVGEKEMENKSENQYGQIQE